MSSYRFDEVTGSWVVVASERRGLPIDARVAQTALAPADGERPCPFCPGRESETEVTVAAIADARGAWSVRVVRNRFPIVTPDAPPDAPPGGRALPARGFHEVVVESPDHDGDLATFDRAQLARVVRMYRDRLAALEALSDVRAVAVFRNRGRRAGSSQSHPHGQLVATTVLPPAVERRHALARDHFARTGTSLASALLARELTAGLRVVAATDAFVAYCPFASHRAYETWIAPRTPTPSFAALPDALVEPLARALGDIARRVARVTGDAAYNVVIRTAPTDACHDLSQSWHAEILPRMGGDAGFELGTGIDVVPIEPEHAAEVLRSAGGLDDG